MPETRISGRISPEEITAFLRHVRNASSLFAVELINTDLDDGVSISRLFSDGLGYHLHATALRRGEYRIRFGCQAGIDSGDGGEWIVRYDERGTVAAAVPVSQYVV